jgi:hypothetical protein
MKGLYVDVYDKDASSFSSHNFTIFINLSNVVYLKNEIRLVLLVMTSGSFYINFEDANRIKNKLIR